mmetsp:Transcript_27950/g.76834  ORF Transcript_27950/g.76834 Transcript_27950/m.76834 type:complete len:453 (+) Transcript_27950:487-1845(+)
MPAKREIDLVGKRRGFTIQRQNNVESLEDALCLLQVLPSDASERQREHLVAQQATNVVVVGDRTVVPDDGLETPRLPHERGPLHHAEVQDQSPDGVPHNHSVPECPAEAAAGYQVGLVADDIDASLLVEGQHLGALTVRHRRRILEPDWKLNAARRLLAGVAAVLRADAAVEIAASAKERPTRLANVQPVDHLPLSNGVVVEGRVRGHLLVPQHLAPRQVSAQRDVRSRRCRFRARGRARQRGRCKQWHSGGRGWPCGGCGLRGAGCREGEFSCGHCGADGVCCTWPCGGPRLHGAGRKESSCGHCGAGGVQRTWPCSGREPCGAGCKGVESACGGSSAGGVHRSWPYGGHKESGCGRCGAGGVHRTQPCSGRWLRGARRKDGEFGCGSCGAGGVQCTWSCGGHGSRGTGCKGGESGCGCHGADGVRLTWPHCRAAGASRRATERWLNHRGG